LKNGKKNKRNRLPSPSSILSVLAYRSLYDPGENVILNGSKIILKVEVSQGEQEQVNGMSKRVGKDKNELIH
ncbi:hypothetical protein SK128_020359, partial [Halocaridina rubra]